MTPTDETVRAAYAFIDRFGPAAVEEAAQRAKELREAGDLRGCDRWLRIQSVIEGIFRERPDSINN